MKSLKKLLSIFAAFMMVVGLTAVNVKAAEDTATITVTNATNNADYKAYKLFSVEAGGKGYYATESEKALFEGKEGNPFVFEQNANGTWNVKIGDKTPAQGNEKAVKYTATDIVNFINNNYKEDGYVSLGTPISLTISGNETAGYTASAEVTLGYYFITSSVGSVVMVDTANIDVDIKDKNKTEFDKTVGDSNLTVVDYAVGDTVPYQIKLKAFKGWTNTIVTDELSKGLIYKTDSNGQLKLTIKKGNEAAEEVYVTPKHTNVWSFEYNLGDFSEETEVVISYEAEVTQNATYQEFDTNKAALKNDNNPNISGDEVRLYTWQFSIEKQDGSDHNKKLNGAEFELYKTYDSTTKTFSDRMYVTKNEDGTYSVTTNQTEINKNIQIVTSGTTNDGKDAGAAVVKGLDAGTYYLKETKAPAGYNLMTDAATVTITASSTDGVSMTQVASTATIDNKTGSTLPSTGGMGTTMLYVAGAILMVGAAVIFVTNKRMKHE